MDYKQYIEKRIQNLRASNKTFKKLSILLLIVGIFLILLPILKWLPPDVSNEYAQYGFGFINVLTPVYLQGLISRRKSQIIDLELIKGNLDNSDMEESILKKVLEKL